MEMYDNKIAKACDPRGPIKIRLNGYTISVATDIDTPVHDYMGITNPHSYMLMTELKIFGHPNDSNYNVTDEFFPGKKAIEATPNNLLSAIARVAKAPKREWPPR